MRRLVSFSFPMVRKDYGSAGPGEVTGQSGNLYFLERFVQIVFPDTFFSLFINNEKTYF